MQLYQVNHLLVSNLLSSVQTGEIAIPEIQRPFVWDSIKVRDLMDSLYKGFPVGYIITWKNPNIRLKDGTLSQGKKILIDGQQRITALQAAIMGRKVIDKEYKEIRIFISFNPLTQEFATKTPAIEKDSHWIADISVILNETNLLKAIKTYVKNNEDVDEDLIAERIQQLLEIKNKQIGFIELDTELDIETVTEIFIRINSKGVVLSQADFAMSKIASHDEYGINLRKLIDYFCHISKEPHYFRYISENDAQFKTHPYLTKIDWLKNNKDDLYDPDYSDVIRVAFTKEFERGKLSDFVSLLSGRNFETRTYEEGIIQTTFQKFEKGVLDFVNQTHFERFLMIIKSAGFISKTLINSQNTLNFAYIVYLKLRDLKEDPALIEHYVKRWFVMSILTGRYSGSAESRFDEDIKSIVTHGIKATLESFENGQLSQSFWDVELIRQLDKSTINSPFLSTFFAAQCVSGDEGFLATGIKVRDMILLRGDIHHIFPKEFLRQKYNSRSEYNQIANYVYAQQEINIAIGKQGPVEYFKQILEQCNGGKMKFGNINSIEVMKENLEKNCIPESIFEMDIKDYPTFLAERRKLIAGKIERYYKGL